MVGLRFSIGILLCTSIHAFSHPPRTFHRIQHTHAKIHTQKQPTLALSALTERQMQFWEDVEEGLNDIAQSNPNANMDRIYQFTQSAQGAIPPPEPSAPGHEPSEEHMEGLTCQPFWDASTSFSWVKELEEKSNVILQEFQSKLVEKNTNNDDDTDSEEGGGLFASDSTWQNNVMGTGWSAIRLQRLGEWNVDNCKQFPRTYELIRSLDIPLAVRGVCFARQLPNSGVAPHSDGRNFILTAHLGLQIPKDCWIQVGGRGDDDEDDNNNDDDESNKRTWEEGKVLVLDTSFVHSTGNPSEEDRHVLILDFWHPDLTEVERASLEFVYDLRNKFESGEVPLRTPRALLKEKENSGLAGLWNSIVNQ